MRVAINGAGVAGPTLAWWLLEHGHEPFLVEQAPGLRHGGYVIDFWGLGYDIAERMGLVPRLRELGYQVEEIRFVDEKGQRAGGFDADVFGRMTGGRFTSLRRSDLAATIFKAVDGRVETLFGNTVTDIEDLGDRLRLDLEHGAPREVDLLIGADGLHSRIRELVFGPEADVEHFLDYHVAAFELEGYRPRDELVYVSHAAPGRQVSRFSMRDDRTLLLFVFHDDYFAGSAPASDAERRAVLRASFGDVGWECPRILDGMEEAGEIYFDRVSQIRMDRWTSGRVALIGDAAACVSLLAGEGTGLAMAEAYVLAGELARSEGDHASAFRRYENRLRPFLARKQKSAEAFAASFAPRTGMGIRFRNLVTRLLRIGPVADWFIGRDLKDDIELPDY